MDPSKQRGPGPVKPGPRLATSIEVGKIHLKDFALPFDQAVIINGPDQPRVDALRQSHGQANTFRVVDPNLVADLMPLDLNHVAIIHDPWDIGGGSRERLRNSGAGLGHLPAYGSFRPGFVAGGIFEKKLLSPSEFLASTCSGVSQPGCLTQRTNSLVANGG